MTASLIGLDGGASTFVGTAITISAAFKHQ
jgi:hypothetical protein